jgi:Phosphoesterase family
VTSSRAARIVVIVLENRSMADVQTNSYFASLVARGKLLSNYVTIANPSQPNYLALAFGDTMGVTSNAVVDIPGRNIVDLLEEAGVPWKAYQEDYPGGCNPVERAGGDTGRAYARKHNPFISADTVRQDPARCEKIVDHRAFEADIAAGALPRYSLFVPNAYHSSHDTDVAFAADWLQGWLEPKLANPALADVLWVITWDEGTVNGRELLLTVMLGRGVVAGSIDATPYNHYALLRTTQELLGLGSLGRNDAAAPVIPVFDEK